VIFDELPHVGGKRFWISRDFKPVKTQVAVEALFAEATSRQSL